MTEIPPAPYSGTENIEPSRANVKVFANSGPFEDGAARAIWSGTEGFINAIQAASLQLDEFPIFKGLNQTGGIIEILSGSTATDLWAMY